MRLNPLALIPTVVFFLPLSIISAQIQAVDAIDIDLLESRFNGKRINEITLDDITNWLGRPSAIDDDPRISGVNIYYHAKGLVFYTAGQKEDNQQHCRALYVHLSQAWDEKFLKQFSPYSGTISKNVNGGWKIDRVKSEFNDFQIKEYDSNNESIKGFAAIRDLTGNKTERAKYLYTSARIDMKSDASSMTITYEPNTKFIDWISLWGHQQWVNILGYPLHDQEDTKTKTSPPATSSGPKREKSKSQPSSKPR